MALELYEVRETMEALAARLASERVSDEVIKEMEKCLEEQALIVNQEDAVAIRVLIITFISWFTGAARMIYSGNS
jgi:DNA-binding GntR family transcriptional regulator